jgi:hypothetical protein
MLVEKIIESPALCEVADESDASIKLDEQQAANAAGNWGCGA